MGRITKRVVDAANPQEQEYFLWDDELRGFGVRVRPSGVKTYLVQYRIRGRQRRVSLGEHGRLTPDQARRTAFGYLNQVVQGEDPALARELDRRSATVREFAAIYLRDAALGLVTYRGKPKKHSTLSVDRGRIGRHILPLLGERRLRDLTHRDIRRFIGDVPKPMSRRARGVGQLSQGGRGPPAARPGSWAA